MGLPLFDLADAVQSGMGQVPATKTSTANGSSVDMRDCGPVFYSALMLGACSGTNATLNVTFEESDDDSTFTTISGAAHAQKTGTSDNTVELLEVRNRTKRYVRPVLTIAADANPSFAVAILLSVPKSSY